MAKRQRTARRTKPEDFLLPDVPEFEEVTLPSGLQVKLRSPAHEEFWLRAGDLPGFLLPPKPGEKRKAPEPRELIRWGFRVVAALVAEPVFSLEPKEGEIHPRRLRLQDRVFLGQYYARQMLPGGRGAAASAQKPRGKAGARRTRGSGFGRGPDRASPAPQIAKPGRSAAGRDCGGRSFHARSGGQAGRLTERLGARI